MERSAGTKNTVYGMLMTVLFYTTGFICGLRTVAWLAMHMLIPAISRIIALCYRPSSSNPGPPTPAAGLLFKLVHAAAGRDLLVPVPVPESMYHISAVTATEGAGTSGRTLVRLALLSSLVSAGGLAAYYYFSLCGPPAWTWGKITRRSIFSAKRRHGPSDMRTAADGTSPAPAPLPAKTKLNPAAPAFTPSSALHRLLDPTARTFATPTPPPSPADSAGPVTPSPASASCVLPSAFALAAARVARAGAAAGMGGAIKSGGGAAGGGRISTPVGVGKMRVVRPEEVVVGERRADEVFVFF